MGNLLPGLQGDADILTASPQTDPTKLVLDFYPQNCKESRNFSFDWDHDWN
ncbi:rCG57344 [Rattus norvegicus]|uniref:RCG57344 n=1 Tax=Rattus norvegicus TaxID=10116 RepID=A6JP89_RAT|nr:rCG57344 [Rattus norvegicus]